MSGKGNSYRVRTKIPYPRLQLATLSLLAKAASNGAVIYSFPKPQIYAAMKASLGTFQSLVQGGAAGSAGTFTNQGTGGFLPFDPSIEDLSICAMNVTTSAHLLLAPIAINGYLQGVAVDVSITNAVLFAEVLTLASVTGVTKLANPAQPGALPVEGDLQFAANVQGGALAADEFITVTAVFWVTPRADL